MIWIAALLFFLLSGITLAEIESFNQLLLGLGFGLIGVGFILSHFYRPDPMKKKKLGLQEEAQFFEEAAKKARKKYKEIGDQETLAAKVGRVWLSADGTKKEWVEKIDGEWQILTEPLKFFEKNLWKK